MGTLLACQLFSKQYYEINKNVGLCLLMSLYSINLGLAPVYLGVNTITLVPFKSFYFRGMKR